MRQLVSRVWKGFLVLMALAAAFSCTFPLAANPDEAEVRLTVAPSGARFLASEAGSYKVIVRPAKGTTVVATFEAGASVVLKVTTGSATIRLEAFDSKGNLLTVGETEQTLLAGVNQIALTLEPGRQLESAKTFSLSAGQVAYFSLKNPLTEVQTVNVKATGGRVWLCDDQAAYEGPGSAEGLTLTLKADEKQILRVQQGTAKGYVTAQWGKNGETQFQITDDIAVEWSTTVVNRLDNENLNLKFRLGADIAISEVYLDGVSQANGSTVWWNSDVGSAWLGVSNYGPTIAPGPHQVTVIFYDTPGNFWSYTHDYQLIERQPVVVSTSVNWNTVVMPDSSLWIWAPGSAPARLGTEYTWRSISAGTDHFAALKNDSSLWTWGLNTSGQLARVGSEAVPTRVGVDFWKEVSAGADHTLLTWTVDPLNMGAGSDSFGQLNGAGDSSIPVYAGEVRAWKLLAGDGFSAAINQDNSPNPDDSMALWTWGRNDIGLYQLGHAGTTKARVLVGVELLTRWRDAAVGTTHMVAIKDNNTLWTWGMGTETPLQVTLVPDPNRPWQNDMSWNSVAAGDGISFGLQYDGSLWGWGSGIGTVPTLLTIEQNWKRIEAGGNHLLAVDRNNAVWTWTVGDTTLTKVLP